MKHLTILMLVGLMVGPVALAKGMKQKGKKWEKGVCQAIENLPIEELSDAEKADLVYLREEEKVARDVYLALQEEWGLRVFRNIASSEATHMSAVLTLIERHDLVDPVGENGVGVFTNGDLQDLHDSLVAKGKLSVDDAVIVGATIEDMDIFGLQEMIGRTEKADLLTVYQNLTKGSRNHLRAFHRQLVRRDLSYTPQYITQAEYDEIVSTPRERRRVDEYGAPSAPSSGQQHRSRHGR